MPRIRTGRLPLLVVLLLSLGGCAAPAPEPADGVEALARAAEALRRAARVRYDFSFRGEGALAGDFTGSAEMERVADVGGSRIRVRIRDGEPQPSGVDLLLATDGQVVTLIDHSSRTVQHGALDGGGSSLFAMGLYGALLEFVEADPLAADIGGSDVSLHGTAEVSGRPCTQVRVVRPTAEILWCFDERTHLPLRQIWHNRGPMPPGSMHFELTDVEVPAAPGRDRFRPESPAGYDVQDVEQGPVALGAPAPGWELPGADGSAVSAHDLRGPLTVLVFWASWCSNCHRILDDVEAIQRDFGSLGVQVVGFSTWEQDDAHAREYMRRRGYTFRHVLRGEEAAADYQMTSLPGLYVLDAEGRFLLVRIGPAAADMAALRSLVRRAAAEAVSPRS